MNLLTTSTDSLIETDVVSQVTVYEVNMGTVCYFGSAINLEPNLLSYLSTDDAVGPNCNFTNGCGVHIHNGTSCLDKNSQGGHFYNAPEDPWLNTMYTSTDATGDAYFTGCVETGVTEGSFVDRAFIVHSDNGTRVSCGLLTTNTTATDNSPPRPAPSPTRSNNDSAAAASQWVLPMLFYSWMMAAVVTVVTTTIL
jgi:hypothetical protein